MVLSAKTGEPDSSRANVAYAQGRALKAAGQIGAAIGEYQRALDLDPQLVNAHISLGIALRAAGRNIEAIAAYRRALALDSSLVLAWRNLGNALLAEGLVEDALAAYRQVTILAPNDLQARRGIAQALTGTAHVEAAIAAYREVIELDPANPMAWHNLANLHDLQGDVELARQCYDRAIEHAATAASASVICRESLLPTVLAHGTDIDAVRAGYRQRLHGLLDRPLRLEDPLIEGCGNVINGYFLMAYHGQCNRELHELLATVLLRACPGLEWFAPHCRPGAQRREGPIRIGFISSHFRQHSIGKTSVGLMEQLARPEFQVTALFLPPVSNDAMATRIASAADHTVRLHKDLATNRRIIADLELDILFYQDIGMEAQSYLLAFARLAPVQCVSFGHPDTTGIPNMDAWISSSRFEPPGADAHYSERLYLIEEVGTLAFYDRPGSPADQTPDRVALGLPENVPLLACAQTLFKLHPEMDVLLAAILARLPNARLIFTQATLPDALREQLMARWRAQGGGIDTAAIFFGPLEHSAYLSLLSVADVVLDPIHFNGMNSSLEALSLGTPVVTLPTGVQRGRHTQAMYRRMGYTELIAANQGEYVDLAVRLATSPDFRAHASRQILDHCPVLFREEAVVRGFEDVFRRLMRER